METLILRDAYQKSGNSNMSLILKYVIKSNISIEIEADPDFVYELHINRFHQTNDL
jgi:hypothetical protein